MNYLWPVILQALAFAALFAEILIPSFGVLSLVALGLGIWSWIFIASEFSAAGIAAFAAADIVLVPFAVRLMFRYLGRSPVSHVTDVGTGSGLEDTIRELERHVGREVVTATALRPTGKILVEGDAREAVSGEFVEKGAVVRIVAVRGAEFLVEKI